MPSPFPGMNPYLEHPSVWENFHNSLIVALRGRLAPAIRPRYFIGLQENVYIHELPDEPGVRMGKPDLSLRSGLPALGGGTATLEAPARARILAPVEEVRVPYLAITDRNREKVVTVIEVLSPSNKKPGEDRSSYLRKRQSLLFSPANLVEIDLLRRGPRLPAEEYPKCDYSVVVSRPAGRPIVEVWPVMLRERLPIIAIPLQAGDDEPRIDLQELLHEVYDAAGFDLVAYRNEPDPSLEADDAVWAKDILKSSLVE